jgi:hypothetical protein
MSIFKNKKLSYRELLKLRRRVKQNRRMLPGGLRKAGDYFRAHPKLCRKAA